MPYIMKVDRSRLRVGKPPVNVGELNYAITMLLLEYISLKGKGYENINAAVGALECAKLEFYRRLAAPYEDTKIEENGDVY